MLFWSQIVVTVVGLVPNDWKIAIPIRGFFNYAGCAREVIHWHEDEAKRLTPSPVRRKTVLPTPQTSPVAGDEITYDDLKPGHLS